MSHADQTDTWPPPQSLYLHVPFCVRKCGYCDFYSVEPGPPTERSGRFQGYLRSLRLEADGFYRQSREPLRLRTIYVGGGTPSILPEAVLGELLDFLHREFDLGPIEEFTFEANPGVINESQVTLLLSRGVNRLSLGVQSLNEPTLRTLGRIHGAADVAQAVEMVRRAGLPNLSLDMIFGVPGQSLADWLTDLRKVLALEPEHLSVYGLTLSPETPLGRLVEAGELQAVADELYVEMLEAARETMLRAGYEHYEISNFARPGLRCRHNVVYWRNRSYLGLGPAASSYVGGTRWTNVADLAVYEERVATAGSPVAFSEHLDPLRRAGETAMLNLRTSDGIDLVEFQAATGHDPRELFAAAIARHLAGGLLTVDEQAIRLTPRALPIANLVLADFV